MKNDLFLYRISESKQIVKKLKEDPNIQKALKVAAFYPTSNEPDIRPLLEELAKQKKLLLPRTLDLQTMVFHEVNDLKKDLIQGRFQIWEPKEQNPVWEEEIPVFIIPGRKFSTDGGRFGKGKGYYDRYLAQTPSSIKIGIGFAEQTTKQPLCLKPHDIRMNYIVTSEVKE